MRKITTKEIFEFYYNHNYNEYINCILQIIKFTFIIESYEKTMIYNDSDKIEILKIIESLKKASRIMFLELNNIEKEEILNIKFKELPYSYIVPKFINKEIKDIEQEISNLKIQKETTRYFYNYLAQTYCSRIKDLEEYIEFFKTWLNKNQK